MAANFRKTGLALLLAGMGSMYAAYAGLGPIRVLSADGDTFSAEIPVVKENIEDLAQVNLANRNDYPLLSPYSGSAPILHFSLVRGSDGHISKVLVKGPASFAEPLLRFAVEVRWPAGSLVREFEVDYKRDGPRRKAPAPAGGDDGKRHAAGPDQGSRLDGAGLGDIRVSSRLGEPLMAELPLLGGAFDKTEQLHVAILPDAISGGLAKEQLPLLASISHQIDRAIDGRRILRLSSSQPMTQPKLSFRLEVAAGSIKAQKTYSLQLDGLAQQAKNETARPIPQDAKKPSAAEGFKSYKVKKGDTLSAIALGMSGHARGESVSGKLLLDNPDAFINGDANRLLAGAELRYPSSWTMRTETAAKAPASSESKAMKPVGMAKLLEEGRNADVKAGVAAAPKAEARAESKAAAKVEIKPEPKHQAPAKAASAASSPEALAAERRMRDMLQKQDQALQQTEQRAKALEEQIRAIQQAKSKPAPTPAPVPMPLIAQNAPAVPAQEKEQAKAPSPPPVPPPVLEHSAKEASASSSVAALASKLGISESAKSMPPSQEVAKPAQSEPEKTPAKAAPQVARKEEHPAATAAAKPVASVPHSAPQVAGHKPEAMMPREAKSLPASGMVDEAMAALSDKDVLIKLGGAAAALGLVALLLMRRKRAGGADAPADESAADQAAKMRLKPLTSLMSSLKRDDGIDLDSVDVMAEAEVYLAYGRDDQALLILRDGLEKEPLRQDLRHKLLEVLASQPDKKAFIEEATAAKGMFSKDSTMWLRICELGRAELPDHPLFAAAEPAPALPDTPKAAAEPSPSFEPAPRSAPPSVTPAGAGAEDAEKMELAKLYMEMGDKETAELLMREAQQGR
ncbi:hypothetical protein DK842_20745 [Chromobacterium phragmitis]|uniref:type IV pilus assembly protein FimV n=1 Tax=Chromobacterium phragmitis TaxID=2202141 RepID=UPI000DECEF19|nr:hypothetical protein [Chromobacterium phragmitis]AXE32112.1 hypothetical protein DK842_20745 [Chromobacterium phragmitis]